MSKVPRPSRHDYKLIFSHNAKFLDERAQLMTKYIQDVLDFPDILASKRILTFLQSSQISFNADFGRKGKEGYLKKCSGGYLQGFSRKTGDFIDIWSWRWVVLQDTCICWYKSLEKAELKGNLQLDKEFRISRGGRVITIMTGTRRVLFYASTTRSAEEWVTEILRFYSSSAKLVQKPFESFAPPRGHCEVKFYTVPNEYMQALAYSLMKAQKEILITSWKNSPTVLLTRPPLPPIRLDHILKMKAEEGVMIYVLLYKEVENIGQGNDSWGAKKKLESLSRNIHVIRHPNKFMGGSTAVLWSHHEKFVVIDRNSAYVGGIDLAFQRWDDVNHRMQDEDGLLYVGHDYRQPSPDVFKPAREIDLTTEGHDSDEEMIEVEVATTTEALPQALSAIVGDDGQYEVEVVMDFGSSPANRDLSSRNSPSSPQTPPIRASLLSTHGLGPVGEAPDSDVPDNMSQMSENWEEDANAEQTAEERDMIESARHAGADRKRDSFVGGFSSTISESFASISDKFKSVSERAAALVKNYRDQVEVKKKLKKSTFWETRDLYPRMGWHDMQAGLSGAAARDLASHFIQRWNHHRLSTGDHSKPILAEITDDLYYSTCARCRATNINEQLVQCPLCSHDLGPQVSFSEPDSRLFHPPPPERFSYILFQCKYPVAAKLPFKAEGDCPVVITNTINTIGDSSYTDPEGTMLEAVGPEAEWLEAFSLYPAVGDIIAAVNDIPVSHLNSNQLKRFIKRVRKGLSSAAKLSGADESAEPVYKITFRRHFVEGYNPIDFIDDSKDGLLIDSPTTAEPIDKKGSSVSTPAGDKKEEEEEKPMKSGNDATSHTNALDNEKCSSIEESTASNPTLALEAPSGKDNSASVEQSELGFAGGSSVCAPPAPSTEDSSAPPAIIESTSVPSLMLLKEESQDKSAAGAAVVCAEETNEGNFDSETRKKVMLMSLGNDAASIAAAGAGAVVDDDEIAESAVALPSPPRRKNIQKYQPICRSAAEKEISFSCSKLFHEYGQFCNAVPRLPTGTGSCNVQVLRSAGKWSIGANTEHSIWNAYIYAITNAKHFIYIENQFFVSNNAGSDVQNNISSTIVSRIIRAYNERKPFRLIIIIPVHPNGDFVNALKAKVVMHFEYATINRGVSSMFQSLQRLAPGININDYIGFFSLRNWGAINNRVVSEQIYVHDKLMIVDDDIVIIGSANINDRSMLGCRDSEVAICVEDLCKIPITLGGQAAVGSSLAHNLRVKLMRQHVKDDSIDFSDPLDPQTYNIWRSISSKNSSVYDQIDGNMSLYRCALIGDYKLALASYSHQSILDPEVQANLAEIKGFIVDWPQNLFVHEDLSPTLATRAIIPNELWV